MESTLTRHAVLPQVVKTRPDLYNQPNNLYQRRIPKHLSPDRLNALRELDSPPPSYVIGYEPKNPKELALRYRHQSALTRYVHLLKHPAELLEMAKNMAKYNKTQSVSQIKRDILKRHEHDVLHYKSRVAQSKNDELTHAEQRHFVNECRSWLSLNS